MESFIKRLNIAHNNCGRALSSLFVPARWDNTKVFLLIKLNPYKIWKEKRGEALQTFTGSLVYLIKSTQSV